MADGGLAGGAARAAGHMNGIRDLVRSIFIDCGMPSESIVNEAFLPGYYRARKKWDMAVRYKGALVAALEFNSQVGSVGKNINNRFEEALGTGTDTWAAQTKFSAYGEVPPWLGYVFVLQETDETEPAQSRHYRPVRRRPDVSRHVLQRAVSGDVAPLHWRENLSSWMVHHKPSRTPMVG